MASILITIFTFVLIIISIFMILIVLMQRSSSSGGLGAAFGGGLAESAFGTDTGNILTKTTVYSAIAFFIISFGLYLGYMSMLGEQSDRKLLMPDIEQSETTGFNIPEVGQDEEPASDNSTDIPLP